jgi:hypothetical protein
MVLLAHDGAAGAIRARSHPTGQAGLLGRAVRPDAAVAFAKRAPASAAAGGSLT